MADQKHTQEPWDKKDPPVAAADGYGYGLDEALANQDRAVDCVNPLAGVEDPKLFMERVAKLKAAVRSWMRLKKQGHNHDNIRGCVVCRAEVRIGEVMKEIDGEAKEAPNP